jgi:hypothetical protein
MNYDLAYRCSLCLVTVKHHLQLFWYCSSGQLKCSDNISRISLLFRCDESVRIAFLASTTSSAAPVNVVLVVVGTVVVDNQNQLLYVKTSCRHGSSNLMKDTFTCVIQ